MSSRGFCILFLMFIAVAWLVEILGPRMEPRHGLSGALLVLGFGCFLAAIAIGFLEG